MSDTELVVINNTAPPAVYEEPVDNGNWGDDDEIKPAYIAIKQALTEGADTLPNGTLFHKASGQTWSGNVINMIILSMRKTRSWKPSAPKFVPDEKALCRSNDRKTPLVGENLIPQSSSCATCPKASWAGYDRKARTGPKPTCDQGFFILFLDQETNLPYIFTATGQSVAPCEALYDTMKSQAKIYKAKNPDKPMPSTFHFSVAATTEKGEKAFKIKFNSIAKLTPEAAAKFGPLYEQFVSARNTPAPVEEGETTTYEDQDDDSGRVIEGEAVAAEI